MTPPDSAPTSDAAHTHAPAPSPAAPIRVRFAPAPTGYLHLGGARTALFNWLFARRNGGAFILRIEDTDEERSTSEVIGQVLDSLRWLGLDWDEGPEKGGDCGPYFQSQRKEIHLEWARRLVAEGKAYECYMTPEELEAHRQVAIAAGRPFHYEGWHRELTREQIARFRAEGRRPALRLLVDPPAGGWNVEDLIKGPTHFPPDQIDDFILVRSDGAPSFHLANVVDDATMGVTHVIRGEDHLTNTIRHLLLFERFGLAAPRYAHLPMILGPDRSKLSKRHGAVSVMEYKAQGYLPEAMVNELALLGWSPEDGKEHLTIEELVARFGLDRCGWSGSIFDFAKLDHFNSLAIRAMEPARLMRELGPWMGPLEGEPPARVEALAALLRDELVRLADFPALARRILDEPVYAPEVLGDEALKDASAVVARALAELEAMPEPWDRAEIKARLATAGKAVGVKGKGLFMPVRAAITGALHGPALDGVLAALGKDICLARLRRFLAL